MKNILVIIVLIIGSFSGWADLSITANGMQQIKDRAKEQFARFEEKSRDQQIDYLNQNMPLWLESIEKFESEKLKLEAQMSQSTNARYSKLRKEQAKILINTEFLNLVLRTSSDLEIAQKVATKLKHFVKYKFIRLYILDNLHHFNMNVNVILLNDILVNIKIQYIIVEIISMLLEERKDVSLINKLTNKILRFYDKNFIKQVTKVITKVLVDEKTLSPVINILQEGLNSENNKIQFRSVIALGDILPKYPNLQEHVNNNNKQIVKLIDTLVSILLSLENDDIRMSLKKSIIFTLGHLNIKYEPASRALLKLLHNSNNTREVHVMATRALEILIGNISTATDRCANTMSLED